jgi:hypothetical protein
VICHVREFAAVRHDDSCVRGAVLAGCPGRAQCEFQQHSRVKRNASSSSTLGSSAMRVPAALSGLTQLTSDHLRGLAWLTVTHLRASSDAATSAHTLSIA